MAGLAKSPTSLVIDGFQDSGACNAWPAGPRSSRPRIRWKDLHVFALTTCARPTTMAGRWRGRRSARISRSRTLLLLGPTILPRRFLERWRRRPGNSFGHPAIHTWRAYGRARMGNGVSLRWECAAHFNGIRQRKKWRKKSPTPPASICIQNDNWLWSKSTSST